MPYTPAHKQRTRGRILREAARAFRERGLGGVAIPAVMSRAGLTHGGFYAHFASKDDLVAAACDEGFSEAGLELVDRVAESAPGDELRQIIRAYLSRAHRDDPSTGCMLPSLTPEVGRASAEVRAGFTAAVLAYARKLAGYLPAHAGQTPEEREAAALALLAGMAGALQLARAVDDRTLSDRILLDARTLYINTFVGGSAPAPHDHRADAQ